MRVLHRLACFTFAAALFGGAALTPPHLAQAQDDAPGLFLSPSPRIQDATFLDGWMRLLFDRVANEALSAPSSSRTYAYAGITVYESMVSFAQENRSLSGQLNEMTQMPYPSEDAVYDATTSVDAALHLVLNGLMINYGTDNSDAFNAFFEERLVTRRAEIEAEFEQDAADADSATYSAMYANGQLSLDDIDAIISRSLTYGEELGKALLEWFNSDGFNEMRAYEAAHPYNPDIVTGRDYATTTEGAQPAEPYWGEYIRPMLRNVENSCYVANPVEYSEEVNSTFYQQALEVMDVGDSLTQAQRDTAAWWVDTPGLTGAPAGHWVRIEGQLIDQLDLNLLSAGEMYGMVGISIGDAFTTTWYMKYADPLVRPVTYIQQHINRRWTPFIETPPFPEYPSGHSVVSAAAADMLTFLFGPRAFTDDTHQDSGQTTRHYTTFHAAAEEAAMSRLYGGIHYRTAIETGMEIGDCVSEYALDNIVMRPLSQGGQ